MLVITAARMSSAPDENELRRLLGAPPVTTHTYEVLLNGPELANEWEGQRPADIIRKASHFSAH